METICRWHPGGHKEGPDCWVHWPSECRGWDRKYQIHYEEESNGTIPFLYLLFRRQPDGAVSTEVYRKPTHTDQYLHFRSHHPINHKTGVVRTLMDRKDTMASTENDKNKEELHIRTALQKCGYLNWIFEKVNRISEIKNWEPRRQIKRAHLTKAMVDW